jgi:hypothetical protein
VLTLAAGLYCLSLAPLVAAAALWPRRARPRRDALSGDLEAR